MYASDDETGMLGPMPVGKSIRCRPSSEKINAGAAAGVRRA